MPQIPQELKDGVFCEYNMQEKTEQWKREFKDGR
jgi:hypothetical protein